MFGKCNTFQLYFPIERESNQKNTPQNLKQIKCQTKTKAINQPKKKKGRSVFSESKLLAPGGNQFYQTNLRGFSSKQVEKLTLFAFFLQVSLKVTSRNPSFLTPIPSYKDITSLLYILQSQIITNHVRTT